MTRTHTRTYTQSDSVPHRCCLAWGPYPTSKGHLWHFRSLPNDDAQRSFATTKKEQKNRHEREVNKHMAINKTFFYWIQYKEFFFPKPHYSRTHQTNSWLSADEKVYLRYYSLSCHRDGQLEVIEQCHWEWFALTCQTHLWIHSWKWFWFIQTVSWFIQTDLYKLYLCVDQVWPML